MVMIFGEGGRRGGFIKRKGKVLGPLDRWILASDSKEVESDKASQGLVKGGVAVETGVN